MQRCRELHSCNKCTAVLSSRTSYANIAVGVPTCTRILTHRRLAGTRPIGRQFPHSSGHCWVPGWQWRAWAPPMTEYSCSSKEFRNRRGASSIVRGGGRGTIVSPVVSVTKQLRQFPASICCTTSDQKARGELKTPRGWDSLYDP